MDLKTSILEGSFSIGHSLLKSLSSDEIENELNLIAFETEKIEVYFFILSIISVDETAFNHYLAAQTLSTAFCHISGAYNAAYYHAKKANTLAPNDVTYLEHLLLYYNIPEKLICDEEALSIANKILKIDIHNVSAKAMKNMINR